MVPMDMNIQVGGEPPQGRGRGSKGRWTPLAQAARDNPDVWVHVDEVSPNLAASIRKGELAGFEKNDTGWFEATARGVKGKRCTVWVKYHTGVRNGDSA